MTSEVETQAGESPEDAYVADRCRLIRTRIVWGAGLALVPIAIAALVNALVFTERLGERVATFALEAALCVGALLVARHPRAERHAIGLALGLVLGMEAALLWALSLSPTDLDVLVGPIISTMVASTLLFPWGIRPQAITSVCLASGYLLLPSWSALDASRTTNVLIGLAMGCLTSVVGAWLLDRQRRAIFVERERVAALARQRELLVEAGRELNGTLDLATLVERIMRQGRRLVGSAGASLALFDDRREVLVPVAVEAGHPERDQALLGIEFPVRGNPFIEALQRDGILELPDGSPADRGHDLAARWGFGRTLYVAIKRDARLLGIISFAQRAGEPPLTTQHRSLAEGFAHQAAIALANARLVEDLQTASRIKSEFVSTMSHELRTPLNVILGFAEMARDGAVDGPQRETCLERIDAAGRDLLGLIESTLEIGKIEAGCDDVQLGPLALPGFWAQLGEACARMPRAADVRFEWRQPVPDRSLITDVRKLTVVMRNLVGNALKFTEHGWVRVEAAVEGREILLRIADTGIGIRPEDQETIFEMFRQADGSDTRRFAGTGLGLYIVRRFVHQLGGTIKVDSVPGNGSIFTVRLPLGGASVRVAA